MSEIQVNTINEYTGANGVTIDGVLVKDGAIASSYISGLSGGITGIDQWKLTAAVTSTGDITTNLSQVSYTNASFLGTAMSESSGVFTFPSTGHWLVNFQASIDIGASSSFAAIYVRATSNNSTYTTASLAYKRGDLTEGDGSLFCQAILDITDLSNDKVKFRFEEAGTSSIVLPDGDAVVNFQFIRLGDT